MATVRTSTVVPSFVGDRSNDDEPLTVQEAAILVRVSVRTIYTWISAGKVEIVYTPGGLLRVVRSSLFSAPVRLVPVVKEPAVELTTTAIPTPPAEPSAGHYDPEVIEWPTIQTQPSTLPTQQG